MAKRKPGLELPCHITFHVACEILPALFPTGYFASFRPPAVPWDNTASLGLTLDEPHPNRTIHVCPQADSLLTCLETAPPDPMPTTGKLSKYWPP